MLLVCLVLVAGTYQNASQGLFRQKSTQDMPTFTRHGSRRVLAGETISDVDTVCKSSGTTFQDLILTDSQRVTLRKDIEGWYQAFIDSAFDKLRNRKLMRKLDWEALDLLSKSTMVIVSVVLFLFLVLCVIIVFLVQFIFRYCCCKGKKGQKNQNAGTVLSQPNPERQKLYEDHSKKYSEEDKQILAKREKEDREIIEKAGKEKWKPEQLHNKNLEMKEKRKKEDHEREERRKTDATKHPQDNEKEAEAAMSRLKCLTACSCFMCILVLASVVLWVIYLARTMYFAGQVKCAAAGFRAIGIDGDFTVSSGERFVGINGFESIGKLYSTFYTELGTSVPGGVSTAATSIKNKNLGTLGSTMVSSYGSLASATTSYEYTGLDGTNKVAPASIKQFIADTKPNRLMPEVDTLSALASGLGNFAEQLATGTIPASKPTSIVSDTNTYIANLNSNFRNMVELPYKVATSTTDVMSMNLPLIISWVLIFSLSVIVLLSLACFIVAMMKICKGLQSPPHHAHSKDGNAHKSKAPPAQPREERATAEQNRNNPTMADSPGARLISEPPVAGKKPEDIDSDSDSEGDFVVAHLNIPSRMDIASIQDNKLMPQNEQDRLELQRRRELRRLAKEKRREQERIYQEELRKREEEVIRQKELKHSQMERKPKHRKQLLDAPKIQCFLCWAYWCLLLVGVLFFSFSILTFMSSSGFAAACSTVNGILTNNTFYDKTIVPGVAIGPYYQAMINTCLSPGGNGDFSLLKVAVMPTDLNITLSGFSALITYSNLNSNFTNSDPTVGLQISTDLSSKWTLYNVADSDGNSNDLEAARNKVNSNKCAADEMQYTGKCTSGSTVSVESGSPPAPPAAYCVQIGTVSTGLYTGRYDSSASTICTGSSKEDGQKFLTNAAKAATEYKTGIVKFNTEFSDFFTKEKAVFSGLQSSKADVTAISSDPKFTPTLDKQKALGVGLQNCRALRKAALAFENAYCFKTFWNLHVMAILSFITGCLLLVVFFFIMLTFCQTSKVVELSKPM